MVDSWWYTHWLVGGCWKETQCLVDGRTLVYFNRRHEHSEASCRIYRLFPEASFWKGTILQVLWGGWGLILYHLIPCAGSFPKPTNHVRNEVPEVAMKIGDPKWGTTPWSSNSLLGRHENTSWEGIGPPKHTQNTKPQEVFAWTSRRTSWWFQPPWKILVKMGIFPK